MPLSRASLLPITRTVSPSFAFTQRSRRERIMTYPLAKSSRQKPRRWPLVLRFGKGSIHPAVIMPLLLHTLFTCAVVWVHKRHRAVKVRFWNGRLHLNTITSAIRCLTRTILVLSPPPAAGRRGSDAERIDPHLLQVPQPGLRRAATRSMPDMVKNWEDEQMEEKLEGEKRTVEAVKVLVAMMYTCMNHLRADWGVALTPGTCVTSEGQETAEIDYKDLLPDGLKGYEHRGLALTLELAVFVESFFALGTDKGWFNTGHLAQMTNELNSLTKAYGNMEVIRLTPIPVAHLIHHQQTLAIYCVFLAFAMASEMGWWAVPIVAFVSFTLYGIEGIAQAFEDPFGKTKIDLKMDDIFEDTRREVEVMLEVWQTQNHNRSSVGANKCRMFVPHTKRRNSVGMTQPAAHVVVSTKDGRHVRWDSSVEVTDTEQESSGATSPRTKEQMEEFGARRVTWGSAVGEADKGVFSTPVFFEGVGV